MVGDVVGRPGRRALKHLLPEIKKDYSVDLVIANSENAAGGLGLSPATALEIMDAGAQILTSGNHIWDQKDIIPYLDGDWPLIRPINYPKGVPGRGYLILGKVMVVNIIGRTFMGYLDCPFRAMDALLQSMANPPRIIIVDLHAEATSEKMALGWYLDGRVSAVLGTHTHVGTADCRVLPKGTAYVTDVGMTGPLNSVIGDEVEAVIERFLNGINRRLPVADGPVIINSVLVDIDGITGRAKSIERVDRQIE